MASSVLPRESAFARVEVFEAEPRVVATMFVSGDCSFAASAALNNAQAGPAYDSLQSHADCCLYPIDRYIRRLGHSPDRRSVVEPALCARRKWTGRPSRMLWLERVRRAQPALRLMPPAAAPFRISAAQSVLQDGRLQLPRGQATAPEWAEALAAEEANGRA